MATKFLEAGGDANFNVSILPDGFWGQTSGAPAIATDFVHGTHIKSIKYPPGGGGGNLFTPNSTLVDAGSRISLYIYLVALPTTSPADLFTLCKNDTTGLVSVGLTTGGVLRMYNGYANGTQIGTSGATLSTGIWYRISLAYTITSTTVNRFELFKDGVSTISITNATVSTIGTQTLSIGNDLSNAGLDFRSSDHYIDDSSALTDPGNIWVTAKRPNANGTTNGFTTQVGAGGSGYGSGHSPQVNERPQSSTNGWRMIGAGSAVTEEYNIEAKGTGDLVIGASDTIVDYMGWLYATSVAPETGSMILNGVSSNISLTTLTVFTKFAASSTYPAGTGTDIGIVTTTALTTVSLYECGVVVAYIPASAVNSNFLMFM